MDKKETLNNEKNKILKNDWKMTADEMENTEIPEVVNKSYDELLQLLKDRIRENNLDTDMEKISHALTFAY